MSQQMLSKFDAGDTTNLDLSLPKGGIDPEARREVKTYARDVTAGGWEFCAVTNDRINWWNPDGPGVYYIERKKAGWHGVHNGRDASPHYTGDLQEAIDSAGELLAQNPVERDEQDGDGA